MESKTLKPDAQIVESLLNLRNELYARQNPDHAEIFFKINSCLYATYRTKEVPKKGTFPEFGTT